MANHNFRVKNGLEVGTGITISGTDGNINISGIITAQFKGDGSQLTGVTAEGSGVVIREEGNNVGTAATINFIGPNVTATLSSGIANITVGAGDLSNVVEDTTPQLGGNLDLNSKNISGTGNILIDGAFSATGVSTFAQNVTFESAASFGDNDKINVGTGNDLQIFHDGTSNIISDAVGAGISLVGNTKVVGVLTATSFSGSLATTDLTGTITNAQLANSSVTFGGVSVALGATDATPAFDLSDATNYPTSSLSGTITNAQLAGSIADGKLASTFLKNTVEDTTPQLGGNLDVNSKDITGTGNVSLTGVVTATSFSGSGSALTGLTGASAATYGSSSITPVITVDANGRITGIATVVTSGGGGGGISNVVEDITPQLGGDLDLNSKTINGTGNININGYAAVSGVSTFTGAVGFATHLHDAGTGEFEIRTNLLRIKNDAGSETLATLVEDGAVSLYHDNTLKINTTSDGAVVTGILTATSIVKSGGSSSQFLKADGSVDTSTYLTSETDPVVGAISGIVKANGSGTISAATAGTDYLTPTGDGSGLSGIAGTSFSNIQATLIITASGNNYRFTGPGHDTGDNQPDLYLVRGQRYRFTNNSGGSHPFQIRSSPGGSAYSTGVTNNGASSGNIEFNVQHDAPDRLYYQCTVHSAMVGNIYIVGASDWRMTNVATNLAPQIYTGRRVYVGMQTSYDSNSYGQFKEGISIIRGDEDGNVANATAAGQPIGGLYFNDARSGTYGSINCVADGTPGTNDYPGRLVFRTCSDGSGSTTERLRITSDGKVRVPDSGKFTAGAGDDLSIFHNGTHNFIESAGSADLYVRGANILLQDHVNSNRNWLIGLASGALELYHSGTKKLETTSGGVTVTGSLTATTSTDEHLVLAGSNAPYIRFQSGTTNKAYLQYDLSSNSIYLWNSDSNTGLRLTGSNAQFYDGSGYRTLWNDANDGAGSGLDADTVDGFNTSTSGGANKVLVSNSSNYLILDSWLRIGNGAGMYTAAGGHFYEDSTYGWFSRSRTTSSSIRLQVSGSAAKGWWYADSSANQGFLSTAGSWMFKCDNSGNVTATGNVTAYSDARIKENVRTVDDALEKVKSMRGVYFDRKDTGKASVGVIAQEVEEVLPQVVETQDTRTEENSDGLEDLKTVSYGNIVGVLIEAIKDQQKQIDELKAKLENN